MNEHDRVVTATSDDRHDVGHIQDHTPDHDQGESQEEEGGGGK